MSVRRKQIGGGGGHGGAWIITFADLVSLLMAFFVMIVSFSTQEQEKVAHAAGSIREAFGVQRLERPAGMIEREGIPVRDHARSIAAVSSEQKAEFAAERNDGADIQGPEANTHRFELAEEERPRQFLSAAVAVRQALGAAPDLADLARQVIIEEDEEGLNIRLVDEDGRTMFDQNTSEPTPALRHILERIGPVLARLPNRVRLSGHTSSNRRTEPFGPAAWRLSVDRALAGAELLTAGGLAAERIDSVVGKADSEPLFPNDPFLSANRRLEIVVMHEAPPLPLDTAQ